MTRHSRHTSPLNAGARFVAQRMLLKPLVWSITDVTVLGLERLETLAPPFIVVANHSSHLDAPIVMNGLPRRLSRYLAANAAADYFLDVWWRKGLTELFFNAFWVDRTGLRGRSGVAAGLLEQGVPLLIFPEGGRSKTGTMGNFKPGAAALSISRDVPCVPAALVGAYDAMPKDAGWVRRGRPPVVVNYGEPISPEPDESATQFSARLAKEVQGLYDEGIDHLAAQARATLETKPGKKVKALPRRRHDA